MQKYLIRLADREIGHTLLESADPPMGVVFGKIIFSIPDPPHSLFHEHCLKIQAKVNDYDPDIGLIDTQVISDLRAFREDGLEITDDSGACVTGFTDEGYDITILGIPYPFYGEEFPHHREAYDNQFKE